MVGLGCEVNQLSFYVEEDVIAAHRALTIQDLGGTKKTVERALVVLAEIAQQAAKCQREPIPVSELKVGLQCGGSDGASGITANPALGVAVDILTHLGGTGILSETPEVYGAEHLLLRRAATPEVAEKLNRQLEWWQGYAQLHGASLDNNPSPGNKKGGLTTILEKSLGAVAKGGGSPLNAVYDYAEQVQSAGLVFMDTPGYDPVSATGQIAGGANLIVFTTGRGSCFGARPVPSLKVASNSRLFEAMPDDMDLNAGTVLSGNASIEQVGQELFEAIIAVASGEPAKSEQNGYGDFEFVPWNIGATL
jgi:altronate hydrolase